MADPFIGEIRMFGGNFAPTGWAMCDGQLLPISQNAALFSILGTYFGGNGTTNFALPDLRGRVPIHQGQGPGLSPYAVGENAGTENVTLTSNQMPIHTHVVHVDGTGGGKNSPSGNFLGTVATGAQEKMYSASTGNANATMNPGMIAPAGGNLPVPIIQPFECVTFIIALVGIFPSRN
jgi:microcystin-dependent protein